MFLYSLLAFCFIDCFGQTELLGTYEGTTGESIKFAGKDSFYYRNFPCTQSAYGKGRCEISNGYLYLYFEGQAEKDLKAPAITRSGNSDSIGWIKITCFDYNNNPLQLVTIAAGLSATTTRSSGEAVLKLAKTKKPITITLSSAGLATEQLILDYSGYYDIKVYMRYRSLEIKNGEVYVYETEDISEDILVMRPIKATRSFVYKKKN